MTHAFFSLTDRFRRFRVNRALSAGKRTRSLRIVRAKPTLRRERQNPELRTIAASDTLAVRLLSAWQNRRIRKRWRRELQDWDDRLLKDVGVSRADAEQAFRRAVRRPGVWI